MEWERGNLKAIIVISIGKAEGNELIYDLLQALKEIPLAGGKQEGAQKSFCHYLLCG